MRKLLDGYWVPQGVATTGRDPNDERLQWLQETKMFTKVLEEADSLDILVKHTEESRKERQRRIDAGDETARLKPLGREADAPKVVDHGWVNWLGLVMLALDGAEP
eukprot:Skav236671  [mRNA]  locus=scaffold338:291176:292677:- [translate_table: standard]